MERSRVARPSTKFLEPLKCRCIEGSKRFGSGYVKLVVEYVCTICTYVHTYVHVLAVHT